MRKCVSCHERVRHEAGGDWTWCDICAEEAKISRYKPIPYGLLKQPKIVPPGGKGVQWGAGDVEEAT